MIYRKHLQRPCGGKQMPPNLNRFKAAYGNLPIKP